MKSEEKKNSFLKYTMLMTAGLMLWSTLLFAAQSDENQVPGRDRGQWLDIFGWITVIGALGGVVLHAAGRFFASGNDRKNGKNGAK